MSRGNQSRVDRGFGDRWRRAIAAALAAGLIALAGASPQRGDAQDILGELVCNGALTIPGLTGERPPITAPAIAPTPQPPLLGFNEDAVAGVHGIAPVDYVGLVRTIGGNALRTNIDWRNAEPKRDCWDLEWWAHWRDLYVSALLRGVRPIFIIASAPDWARDQTPGQRECRGYAGCVFPPRREMDGEWAEFATEVARNFPQAMIEIWNEPNLGGYWSSGPNPERFAELTVLADAAIAQASPDTEVIAGGLLAIRKSKGADREVRLREFLARAYDAHPSIHGHVDYLGLHPYTTRARIGRKSAFVRGFRDMRAIRDARGDTVPILVTEFGVSTNSPGVDETLQTETLDRVHTRIAATPDVAGVIYHRVIEPRDTSDDPQEIGYAWLRHGRTPPEPRPVYCHFAAKAGQGYPGC